MISIRPVNNPEFRLGDNVVLAEGTYQGTPGVFLRFREDADWADIQELNGRIRAHPMRWLQRSLVLPRLKEDTK